MFVCSMLIPKNIEQHLVGSGRYHFGDTIAISIVGFGNSFSIVFLNLKLSNSQTLLYRGNRVFTTDSSCSAPQLRTYSDRSYVLNFHYSIARDMTMGKWSYCWQGGSSGSLTNHRSGFA